MATCESLRNTNRTLEAPFHFSNEELSIISDEVRKGVFEICINVNSGHIGGSSSSVELMTALYFGGNLRYNPKNLRDENRDRVLVRGHLGPLRYKIFSLLGEVTENELTTYRQLGSRLQGHEEWQELPGVDLTPSGSLGMLLSYGVGNAIAAKELRKDYNTFVFLGDGEEQEGMVSEAARHAAHLNLDNLVVILDRNKKQLSDPVTDVDSSDLRKIWEGYGWSVIEIENGHNIAEIQDAYKKAAQIDFPVFIIANTIKGYQIEGAEDHFSGYHTISTCAKVVTELALSEISGKVAHSQEEINRIKETILAIDGIMEGNRESRIFRPIKIDIQPTEKTTTNLDEAQGEYFLKLKDYFINNNDVATLFFLTADVTRQDHVQYLHLRDYTKFFNVGIREQHMLGMAHGLSLSYPDSRIIINSLDAFTYRGIDQLNAISQGESSVVIISDVAGITNSRNGKTHQTAGQPGAILSMPGVTMLEPGDVKDLYNCLNWAIGESRGPVFIRTFRSAVEPFTLRGEIENNLTYYPVHKPKNPELTIVASGYTVSSSLKAAKILEREGISVEVINVINQKELDDNFANTLTSNKPVLTVYNGTPEILQASVTRVIMQSSGDKPSRVYGHGFNYGTSGTTSDLAQKFKLDEVGISEISKQILTNV